jgi:uncharacterized protein (DUF58 family)
MITTRSRRLRTYLVLGGGALLLAVALGRPEPVALAAPMLLAATLGLALARTPRLELTTELDRQRALEGEEVDLTLRVKAVGAVARLELRLTLPAGLGVASEPGENRSRLKAGETREYVWRLRCERWGGRLVGRVQVVARDPSGFFTYRLDELHLIPLRVYPRPDALRRLVRPADTQVWAGNEVSREKGEGIEFADIRPFLPGDRVRRVNWRVSARSGQLHVNEMRPERNTDLVVFLDTFTELRTAGESSVDMAVRAALALTRGYLRRRDRVGLVAFGGTLRWLRPDMGERQLYRILDALIDTEVVLSYAWKGLEVFPSRTLPPRSLVIALSPLLDDRSVGALLDLRGRGHDLALLEISPLPFVQPGRREPEELAYRLWGMERDALRARFASRGVAIAAWRRGEPLQAPLAELSALRTRAPVLGRPA